MKLIKIGAMWCSACLLTTPKVEKLVKKYNLEYIDLDYDFDDVSKYNVKDILPVIILENDKEISRLIGEKSEEEIERFIGENI